MPSTGPGRFRTVRSPFSLTCEGVLGSCNVGDWRHRSHQVETWTDIDVVPPSPNVTTETLMDMGYAGGQVPIGDVMSPIDGPFCYKYE